jgi:peptide deformylase
MTIRKVVTWGNPGLKIKSQDVGKWTKELDRLVADLFETAAVNDGVGIAAPQIGINLNIAVIDISCESNPSDKIILINPAIIDKNGSEFSTEGCLSVPGIYETVNRPKQVWIKNRKPSGFWEELKFESQLARIVCHEMDHLKGFLFVDYIGPTKRRLVQRHYNNYQYSRKP